MYALADGVSTADTDYGLVLLHLASGEYWNLNPTGATVLRALLESGRVDAAVDALTHAYDIDRETAEADARAVVADLLSARLLTHRPPAPSGPEPVRKR